MLWTSLNQQEKRARTGKNDDVEVALLRWLREARNQNIILKEAILQEKAKYFGEAFGASEFIYSNGSISADSKNDIELCAKKSAEKKQLLIRTRRIHFSLKNSQR